MSAMNRIEMRKSVWPLGENGFGIRTKEKALKYAFPE
jgi:hypothetical protein